MRRRLLAAVCAVAVLGGVGALAAASAQDTFEPDRVRLLAIFRTRDFGEKAFLSGQFRHLDHPDAELEPYADRRVVLEESPYPFAAWTAVAETTTDQEGYFSFNRLPTAHTRYRVRTEDPPAQSEEPIVRVRLVVALELERRRYRRGSRIPIEGTVTPAHDGLTALIQRRDGGEGPYRTVARARVSAGAGGQASTFAVRVRAVRTADYRVRVPGDADHLPGMTRGVRVVVAERSRR